MNLHRRLQAQRDLDRAELALEAGQLDVARSRVDAAVRLEPDRLEARMLAARVALQSGRAHEALNALDALDLHHPDARHRPALELLRADALAGSGKSDLAVGVLERLSRAFPDDARPHRRLAALHLEHGADSRALEHLYHAVRLAPSDRCIRRLAARILARTDPEAAVAQLLAHGVERAGLADLLEAARYCRRVGRFADAESLCTRLLESCPEDAGVWHEAGAVAGDLGATDLAIRRMDRAAELGRGRAAAALRATAITLMTTGQFNQAGAAWLRLARRTPRAVEPWAAVMVCAIVLERDGLLKRAQRCLVGHSRRGERRRRLAEMWQHVAVGVQLQAAERGEFAMPPVCASPLGAMLNQAVAALGESRDRHPDRADTHYHLAMCHDARGERGAAARCAEKAVDINPGYHAARRLQASHQAA